VLCAEVSRDLAKIIVALELCDVRHHLVMTPAVPEVHQLIEEIAGRLSGDARKVTLARRTPFISMATRAGLHALLYRVERRTRCIGGMRASKREQGDRYA
jgi:hypothetical protein